MEECVCQQEITLSDYNYLDIELRNLFGKKYRKNDRVVIYIYYGLDSNNFNKEIGKFVLVNTKDDSWTIKTNFHDIIEFLQLNLTEYDEFRQDILNLIDKEAYIREQLTKLNNKPKYTYTKKLYYLLK
jgi:hypothetical protein